MTVTRGAVLTMVMVACVGCKAQAPSNKDASVQAATTYLDGMKYKDWEGVYLASVESTGLNSWCSSEAFVRVLNTVRLKRTDRMCEGAQSAPADEPERGEGEMMSQIVRFVCQRPQGHCQDYARLVFESQWTRWSAASAPLIKYDITKTVDAGASGMQRQKVYVDLEFADQERGPQRVFLTSVKTPMGWRVEEAPWTLTK